MKLGNLKLLFLLAFTASTFACSKSETQSSIPAAAHESQTEDLGGMNGGGGGTLPAVPLTSQQTKEVIDNAKKDVRRYILNRMEGLRVDQRDPDYQTSDIEKKLFGGPKTLWDVVNRTEVEVQLTQPCFDADKNPVDGSVHGSKPGAICLSAFRIGPKISQATARNEVTALLFHEYSHLLGTSEVEAISFQRSIEKFLLAARDEGQADTESAQAIRDWNDWNKDAASALASGPTLSNEDLHKLNHSIGQIMMAFDGALGEVDGITTGDQHDLPLTTAERRYFHYRLVRYMLSVRYDISTGPQGPMGFAQSEREYDQIFRARSVITYAEGLNNSFYQYVLFEQEPIASLPMTRVSSVQEAAKEITAFFNYTKLLRNRIQAISENGLVTDLPTDLANDPTLP